MGMGQGQGMGTSHTNRGAAPSLIFILKFCDGKRKAASSHPVTYQMARLLHLQPEPRALFKVEHSRKP